VSDLSFGCLVLSLTILSSSVSAEVNSAVTAADSAAARLISVDLGKGIEADRWGGQVRWSEPVGSDSLSFNHSVTVLLHSNPVAARQWKIDQRTDFRYDRLARRSGLGWFVTGETYLFEDHIPAARTGENAPYSPFPSRSNVTPVSESPSPAAGGVDIHRGHFGAGCRYRDDGPGDASLAFGPGWEKREAVNREGLWLNGQLLRQFPFGEMSAEGQIDRLDDITNHQWWMTLTGSQTFAGEGADRFHIRYLNSRQREYITVNESGRRQDEQLTLNNRLTSAESAPLMIAWDSELRRRRTAHLEAGGDLNDRESVWENAFELRWQTGGLVGVLSGGVDLQELAYAQALSQGRRSNLGLRAEFTPPLVDSLILNLHAIGYRYDTSSTDDLNDRDELRYLLTLETVAALTPDLRMRWEATADLNHLVYLLRPRTSENRWARLFRLVCALPWRDLPIDNRARFEVAAHYSDYDYPPAKIDLSRVYRSFTFTDSLIVAATPRWKVEISLGVLADDNGRLKWQDWVENVSEDGYGISTTVLPTWQYHTNGSLGAGWSWHRRLIQRRESDGRVTISQSVRSSGPTVALQTPAAPHSLQAEFYGAWLTVADNSRGRYRIPEVQFNLLWRI
jgi:hypothetical protein